MLLTISKTLLTAEENLKLLDNIYLLILSKNTKITITSKQKRPPTLYKSEDPI